MKNKRYIGILITVVMITAVLMLLPYKRYRPIGFSIMGSGGVGQEVTESVFDLLRQMSAGNADFVGFLINLGFYLAILSPLLILAELPLLRRFSKAGFLLPVQGLLLGGAAFVIGTAMISGVFESDPIFLPACYGVIVWVSAPVILSFLLVFKGIRNPIGRFFGVPAQMQELQRPQLLRG